MATGVLERTATSPATETNESLLWEMAAGPALLTSPRLEPGPYIYRGTREPHWRGQHCHLVAQMGDDSDDLLVIMACGCQAFVPRLMLELAPADPS
jgi:hypothetical protein